MNKEFLQDYCCINNYHLGPYIQELARKPVILNNIKVNIVHEVIRCIREKFKAIHSSQISSRKKSNKVPQSLPIRDSTKILHDHIASTVRSHTSYLLFDDVLNSNYYQDYDSDDKEVPGTKN